MTPPPSPATEGHAAQTPPPLALDWRKYADLLDDPSIPEDQKRQLIEALWSIISAFVDLGFGLHPVQCALPGDPCQMTSTDQNKKCTNSLEAAARSPVNCQYCTEFIEQSGGAHGGE